MDKIKPVLTVLDTLHIGWYLSSLNITEEEMTYLEECKKKSREGSNDLIEFRGKYFNITSARRIYAFVLYNDDVTIKIARKVSNGKYL